MNQYLLSLASGAVGGALWFAAGYLFKDQVRQFKLKTRGIINYKEDVKEDVLDLNKMVNNLLADNKRLRRELLEAVTETKRLVQQLENKEGNYVGPSIDPPTSRPPARKDDESNSSFNGPYLIGDYIEYLTPNRIVKTGFISSVTIHGGTMIYGIKDSKGNMQSSIDVKTITRRIPLDN